MRYLKISISGHLVLVAHDVEIQRSRPPTDVARPARGSLDSLELGEQLPRRELRLHRDHLIEEGTLRYWAEWLSLLDYGLRDHARSRNGREQLPRGGEMRIPIAHIRAERDISNVARAIRSVRHRAAA